MHLLLLLSLSPTHALAADEPCYGHVWDNRVEGTHFWVEWEDGVIEEWQAQSLLDAMETSWGVFVDGQGWRAPTGSIVVSVLEPLIPGAAGRCLTFECDHGPQPRIEIYPVAFAYEDYYEVVGPHEFFHALQYGYMGSSGDSILSWLWWMEGTATWSEMYNPEPDYTYLDSMAEYLARPQLALHHSGEGMIDPYIMPHMYGTALLADYLDEVHGGPDAIRATWEYGETVTGQKVWFPDAIESSGLVFDDVWEEYLARLSVLDLEVGRSVGAFPALAGDVDTLPAEGHPDEDRMPEGLGLALVRFQPAEGGRNKALYVEFEGDPSVEWHAVLARADGVSPGSAVTDWLALEVGEDGRASGWMSGYDGESPVFLAVSPEGPEAEPYAFSWSAERVRDPGPMDEGNELPSGCGCASGGGPGLSPVLLAWLLALRRRTPVGVLR